MVMCCSSYEFQVTSDSILQDIDLIQNFLQRVEELKILNIVRQKGMEPKIYKNIFVCNQC